MASFVGRIPLVGEARWDDQKLKEVMGTDENGAVRGVAHDPFDCYHNLEDTDRKLIGDFFCRHHPRLAHEFAVFGVPGGNPFSSNKGIPRKISVRIELFTTLGA